MFPATPGMVALGQPRARPGLFDLLDHRARRLPAPGDGRQPAGRQCGRAAADRPGSRRTGRPPGRPTRASVPPTPIDTGHGGSSDGLFTKPPVGQYPAYLEPAASSVRRSSRAAAPVVPDDPVQAGNARVHRVAGLQRRCRHRRPVQRSPWAASRTRRSRCRTRTTTCRRGVATSPLPLRDTGGGAARKGPEPSRLEVVVGDVAADLAAEGGSLQVGVAEVEADEHARPVDVLDHVVEAVVGARRASSGRAPGCRARTRPCRCRRTHRGR